jgi:hypothetical protein
MKRERLMNKGHVITYVIPSAAALIFGLCFWLINSI